MNNVLKPMFAYQGGKTKFNLDDLEKNNGN